MTENERHEVWVGLWTMLAGDALALGLFGTLAGAFGFEFVGWLVLAVLILVAFIAVVRSAR